ncbi:MAG TPA: serine/threonine-protein kinase [Thermoanaerobaculia bacterium]|nr:serine/threonine-protein kinase [Thermoanaerobaculia bacterium]
MRGVLGTGGSAVVYEAFDRELKRSVALKVLRTDRTSEAALKRFRREVAIARDAASPRLVRVFDIGQAGDTVFLTMELVEGESLRELLARGPLLPERATAIAAEVLRALADLHALGIVHRDVKPGNILLSDAGEVKLADFGLARHWEGSETRVTETEALVGTVEYLSPEQALGDLLDARSDLYAVGVVLFEMLAGRVPLRGESAIGTIVAHIRQEPIDVRKLRPEAPAWLSAVVARLLAKDRERRYATAADVLADLEARRARRAPRRLGRALALGGSASLVALLLTLAFVPVFPWNRPRLTRLAPDGAGGVQALDGKGRVLWRRADTAAGRQIALARLAGGETGAIAVPGGTGDPRKRVVVLDGLTGRPLADLELPDPAGDPDGAGAFFGFSSTFAVGAVFPFDEDGDGDDEVAVSLAHIPLWAGATYVCDPGRRRVVVAFYGSGHHYARAAVDVDVDGDGRKELILAGLNNRMGYSAAVAALRIPGEGEGRRAWSELPFAESPDRPGWRDEKSLLAWYALVPDAAFGRVEGQVLEASAGLLRVGAWGPQQVELALDGFPRGPREPGESQRRSEAREEAYALLREGMRLRGAGLAREALAAVEQALEKARAAGDAPLGQWIARARARALLDTGQPGEADTAWGASFERSVEPARIALEAGRAFHLRGDLARAVAWYRRGLTGRGDYARIGIYPRDLMLGSVLALGEAGRWDDTAAEVDRFEAAYPDRVRDVAAVRAFVAWRSGRSPARFADSVADIGLFRYWGLEARRASGEAATPLLADVERVGREAPDVAPLFASLRAELLAALGRKDEARALAAEALDGARDLAATDTGVRAHLSVVEARARSLGVRPAGEGAPG